MNKFKVTPKIEALFNQINSGNLKTNGVKILNYIKYEDSGTDLTQLENYFELKQSTITSRISDLKDMGLIYVDGERKVNKTTYSIFFYEEDQFKQAENREKNRIEKYKQCIKRLIKDFPDFINNDLEENLKSSLIIQTKLF